MPQRVINNLYNSFSNISGIGNIRGDNSRINQVFTSGAKGLIKGIQDTARNLGINKSNSSDFNRRVQEFIATAATAPARQAANISRLDNEDFIGLLSTFLPVGVATQLAKRGADMMKVAGPKATADYIIRAAHAERNNLVLNVSKKSPYVSKKIADNVKTLKDTIKGSIDDTINKFTQRANNPRLSPEERSFAQMVKDNAQKMKSLADDLGVKDKKEIPNLIKFVKQTGDIVKNAPENIRRAARGLPLVTMGATGLSVYDLYQAFKEGGNNLIPSIVSNAAGVASTFIPGGTIAKMLYAGLGYTIGDRLTRAAMQKLGVQQEISDEMKREYESGMAYPRLSEELSQVGEFPVGLSGRKYHVVGDRIYSFDTGRPVPVQQAIDDINEQLAYEDQQVLDATRQAEAQLANLQQMQQSGYNVAPQQIEQAQRNYNSLMNTVANLKNRNVNLNDYDASGDLVAQVQAENGIIPAVGAAEVNSFPEYQAPTIDFNQLYENVYNQVAQRTYDQLDQYINPRGLALEYNNYMLQVANSQAPYMSIDDFVATKKMQAMPAAHQAIDQQAKAIIQNYIQAEQEAFNRYTNMRDYALEVRKQNEVERAGFTDDVINAYKAEETGRHNLVTEAQGAQGLDIEQQRADTAAQTEARQQSLLPYQQAATATEALMNAGYSDVPLDTILNSNPQLFQKVFPATSPQVSAQQRAVAQERRQQSFRPFANLNIPQINFGNIGRQQ